MVLAETSAPRAREFRAEEETDEEIKKLATKKHTCLLALIAPFVPERVAPGRAVYAELRYPEEFMIEEFVSLAKEALGKTKEVPLYLLIHSPGGLASSAYVIASVLRETFSEIVAFVPHVALSGATLIAAAANKVVMGDISQLSPIDPYYREDDKVVYALSVISAFRNLEDYFRTRTPEEASYPWRRLADLLDPQTLDRAARLLTMTERLLKELLERAGYDENRGEKITEALVRQPVLHEEVLRYNKAKEIGLNVEHYTKGYSDTWNIMRKWLRKYYQQPSPVHITRYVIPKGLT